MIIPFKIVISGTSRYLIVYFGLVHLAVLILNLLLFNVVGIVVSKGFSQPQVTDS
jgi:hypothetical protein